MANTSDQSHSESHALNTHACPGCANAAQASATTTTAVSTALPAAEGAPTPKETATPTPAETAARCLSLATRICDQVAELAYAVKGFLALERFVLPTYADETQDSVSPPRGELSAMLRALNAEVLRRIDALELATTVLRAQMSDGEAQAR